MIPDYETLMLPILKALSDGQTWRTREIVARMGEDFELSEDEMREMIPSGRAKLIQNRVGWACTYLRKAGLIESVRRGHNRITDAGRTVLTDPPSRIDSTFLTQFSSFQEFREKSEHTSTSGVATDATTVDITAVEEVHGTPDEIIHAQSAVLNAALRKDLTEQVLAMDPDQFEQLVVDLLVAMGYGGSVVDAGRAIGRSNDGGIDGVIKEDVLGLDTIYIQAKRWQNTVPIKEVRDFAGALLSKRSVKGVFITTSSFPSGAHDFVASIDRRIILIDGERLAGLMIQFNLGVSVAETILLKELDYDYFGN
ncbi:MAG: restriction endonuclease [Alkalispirochaeta sp.]